MVHLCKRAQKDYRCVQMLDKDNMLLSFSGAAFPKAMVFAMIGVHVTKSRGCIQNHAARGLPSASDFVTEATACHRTGKRKALAAVALLSARGLP